MKKSNLFPNSSLAFFPPLLIVVLSMAACSPIFVKALYQEEDFTKNGITDPVYLMPVLDLRVDKSKKIKLDDNAMRILSPNFKKRGYVALKPVKDIKYIESLVEDDFNNPETATLSALGPAEAHWMFFPVLHDMKSKLTFGSTGNAEVSGYIIDKKRGKIVWKHKGIGQAGEGGLVGMAMKGMMAEEAFDAAVANLALAIPMNPASVSSTKSK